VSCSVVLTGSFCVLSGSVCVLLGIVISFQVVLCVFR